MTVWIAVAAAAVGCCLIKFLGLTVPAQVLEKPAVRRLAALLPLALLAALAAVQTFEGEGGALVLDARAAGLAAAAGALLLRAPFLLVIAAAVAVTAAVRALGA